MKEDEACVIRSELLDFGLDIVRSQVEGVGDCAHQRSIGLEFSLSGKRTVLSQ